MSAANQSTVADAVQVNRKAIALSKPSAKVLKKY